MKRFVLLVLPVSLLLFAACSSGGSEPQSINIPYPKADVVTLNLTNIAGQVAISAADGKGVTGTLSTNVGAWRATTSTNGSTITIAQGGSASDVIPDSKLDWNLQLGKGTPLSLNHSNVGADTTLDLGGLSLTQLSATATTANYTLRFDTPNAAADGGTATIQLGNGNFDASGLNGSHFDNFTVTTGGGKVTLDFSGTTLTNSMAVGVNTQSGDILLKIPHNTPAQITYRAGGGTLQEVDPQYTQTNDITFTNGDYSQTPHLTIDVRTVVGDLRLAGGS